MHPTTPVSAHIGIVGLGYVGAVSAACLAKLGHQVYGFEYDKVKAGHLQAGKAPFMEPKLDDLLAEAVQSGRLQVFEGFDQHLAQLDILLICVGTPSLDDGSHNYSQLARVFENIARHLNAGGPRKRPLLIAVRSTVTPGTTADLEKRYFAGVTGARLAYNPEFLREGTAVKDFFEPALVVAGAREPEAAQQLLDVYTAIDAPKYVLTLEAAEMVKGVCNAFHALKISFANETGALAAICGVDPDKLMEVICADTRLNISKVYMKPGFAFGGSCLPKDVRALNYVAAKGSCELPLYKSILASNDAHLDRSVERIRATSAQRVGLVGLSFKSDTDDMRESPALALAAKLVGKGTAIRAFDPDISPALLHGANLATLAAALPEGRAVLMDSFEELAAWADCLVVTKKIPAELQGRVDAAKVPVIRVDKISPAA